MDPNETLRKLRKLLEKWRRAASQHGLAIMALEPADADDIAEHTAALDEWLARGGFLPKAWRPPLVVNGDTGQFMGEDRARYRLETLFDRAIGDHAELDVLIPRPARERLLRLLSYEVIRAVAEERQQLEALARATVTENIRKQMEGGANTTFLAKGHWNEANIKRKEAE